MQKGSMSAVYFERLTRDAVVHKARPELSGVYNSAMSMYKPLDSETHGFGGGNKILSMAAAEANKEQAMLRQIFGVDLHLDLTKPGAIKQLTEAINDAFEFRTIYERNKALITSEEFKGNKGVFSYFHTYFMQAYKSMESSLTTKIIDTMIKKPSISAGDAAKEVFMAELPNLINDGVQRMFNANVELTNSMDQEHRNAYLEIINFIKKFPTQNMFTEGLARAWGLDKVAEEFTKAFSQRRYMPRRGTMDRARGKVKKELEKSMHSKGGLSLEVLIDQCLTMTANKLNSLPNVTASAGVHAGAGAVDARADNVFYFGMNGGRIQQAFDNVEKQDSTRAAAVKEFSNLGANLEKVKNGFIVYVNDKNYTLNENFRRRGGMSAGTAWDLTQVKSLLGGIVGNIDQVVYNLLQNGKGAIMAGDTSQTSEVLAEGIAYYLFDDYTTIGNPGGNAIHVMGLQGMLIPLSAFLFALGTAINSVEQNPSSYVRVTISAPAVDDSNDASYYMANWKRQYKASMENTKISIHFLENFIGFVKGYL